MISFIGIALILKPTDGVDELMILGLMAGFFNACSQVTMHYCSKTSDTFSMTLAMFALTSLYSFLLLLATGHSHELKMTILQGDNAQFWLLIIIMGILTISNQSFRTKAYRYVNKPATLTPFLYTSIVFSGVLDWWVYHRLPEWNTYAGSVLIFLGGIIMAWRGKSRLK